MNSQTAFAQAQNTLQDNGFENQEQDVQADLHTGLEDKKSGRPRSEHSKRAILEATRRLLSHTSVQRLSIEAIAKKAGVGKTTIYRWWPNKAAVVMEAIFSQPGFQNILPTASSARDGVRTQLGKLANQMSGKNRRIIVEILMESQPDDVSLQAFVDQFLKTRYDTLSQYLIQGRDQGEFDPNLDVDAAIDLLLGPIFFRLLTGQALDDDFIERYLNLAMKAV